jgi:hypothetical protein
MTTFSYNSQQHHSEQTAGTQQRRQQTGRRWLLTVYDSLRITCTVGASAVR